jgi:hypothetical protein
MGGRGPTGVSRAEQISLAGAFSALSRGPSVGYAATSPCHLVAWGGKERVGAT